MRRCLKLHQQFWLLGVKVIHLEKTKLLHERKIEAAQREGLGSGGWSGGQEGSGQGRGHKQVANGCRRVDWLFLLLEAGEELSEAGWLWLGTWKPLVFFDLKRGHDGSLGNGGVGEKGAGQEAEPSLGREQGGGWVDVQFTAYMRRFPEKTKCLQQFKVFLLSWGIKANNISWWWRV